MYNRLLSFIREYDMISPGDTVVCAVSGGADSVALLWSLYLLRDKLQIQLSAAHFNHNLRGEESDADEKFVRDLCDRYDIPLYVGGARVVPGKKGLEAAAREARYAFFATLPGKIATAHTADDNAETVLMHLVRGTGLKGLGGIAPVRGNIIRPMLTVTRQDVLALLREYALPYRTDSSNETDAFLRNRLRHRVLPLLKEENPRLAENLSAMAFALRDDEAALASLSTEAELVSVSRLRGMPQALRRRYLENLLKQNGVREPERKHILLAESLVFSQKPSARADFPGNVILQRRYEELSVLLPTDAPMPRPVACPGVTPLPEWGLCLHCVPASEKENLPHCFTVRVRGAVCVRSRCAGDAMRLPGGNKRLKKLFADRKIPAADRPYVPVLVDETGILGVYGIGANLDALGEQWCFRFEPIQDGNEPADKR